MDRQRQPGGGRKRAHPDANHTILRRAMLRLGVHTPDIARKITASYGTLLKVERSIPVRFATLMEVESAMGGEVCALELVAEANAYEPPPGPWREWWASRPKVSA